MHTVPQPPSCCWLLVLVLPIASRLARLVGTTGTTGTHLKFRARLAICSVCDYAHIYTIRLQAKINDGFVRIATLSDSWLRTARNHVAKDVDETVEPCVPLCILSRLHLHYHVQLNEWDINVYYHSALCNIDRPNKRLHVFQASIGLLFHARSNADIIIEIICTQCSRYLYRLASLVVVHHHALSCTRDCGSAVFDTRTPKCCDLSCRG